MRSKERMGPALRLCHPRVHPHEPGRVRSRRSPIAVPRGALRYHLEPSLAHPRGRRYFYTTVMSGQRVGATVGVFQLLVPSSDDVSREMWQVRSSSTGIGLLAAFLGQLGIVYRCLRWMLWADAWKFSDRWVNILRAEVRVYGRIVALSFR